MKRKKSMSNTENDATSTRTKRGRFEIIYDILFAAQTSTKKTHILYGTNLNFNLLKKYFNLLISHEMLKEDDGFFLITEKGKEFLNDFERLENHFNHM